MTDGLSQLASDREALDEARLRRVRAVLLHQHVERVTLAAFEAAHPGIGAQNYPDAFRDESGRLVESEEFFAISSLYGLLEAASRSG